MADTNQDSEYIHITFSKKGLVISLIIFTILVVMGIVGLKIDKYLPKNARNSVALFLHKSKFAEPFVPARWLPKEYIESQVLPKTGYKTKITFASVVPDMVKAGIIDMDKLKELYKARGGIPSDIKKLLIEPSKEKIVITEKNANWLLTLLWPLGIANKMTINEKSPISGQNVGNYASTGGWTLGKEVNGGAYFNTIPLVKLTKPQETRVKSIAESVYRPCCDNSTFFQDCNHGSAALGVIMLGVAQGLTDDEIYKTLVYFNSFWFPQNYYETALVFQQLKNKEWEHIDPKEILSKEYSSISGWTANVDTLARQNPDLIPAVSSSGSCSV